MTREEHIERAAELREKAREELHLPYPSLGTGDPIEIASAQAFALLAIAETLAALLDNEGTWR